MQVTDAYSYRHAEAILDKEYPAERNEIVTVVSAVEWQRKEPATKRRRGNRTIILTVDQGRTNQRFAEEFRVRGWEAYPRIISHSESDLQADFRKGKIQVEVQFGNMARWYTDVFKFLLSYAADAIEVGVLIVPVRDVARQMDENVVNFERIVRELPHAKMAITIPIWVIGLGA